MKEIIIKIGDTPDRMGGYPLEEEPRELIRCGDCKYCYVDGENVRFNMCLLNHNKVQSDNWYCADAEQK